MKRGASINPRLGENFIYEEAQKRLEETVQPIQSRLNHAHGVDYHKILLYKRVHSNNICTCKQVDPRISQNQVINAGATKRDVGMIFNNDLFHDYANTNRDKSIKSIVDELDTNINEFGESTLYHTIQSSEDCDICLRTGYVPGFELYGHNHNVLTTYDIVDILGFTITPDKPARLLKVAEKEGYVDFELVVPKYFSYIKYSVRDNHNVLDTTIFNTKDEPITKRDFVLNAGKTIVVRIKDTCTHVIIDFNLGGDVLHANISQITRLVDWTTFESAGLSNLTVSIPVVFDELPFGSFFLIPERNWGLKIVDVPYLQTSFGKKLDWTVSCRFLQPTEPMNHAYIGNKLV